MTFSFQNNVRILGNFTTYIKQAFVAAYVTQSALSLGRTSPWGALHQGYTKYAPHRNWAKNMVLKSLWKLDINAFCFNVFGVYSTSNLRYGRPKQQSDFFGPVLAWKRVSAIFLSVLFLEMISILFFSFFLIFLGEGADVFGRPCKQHLKGVVAAAADTANSQNQQL